MFKKIFPVLCILPFAAAITACDIFSNSENAALPGNAIIANTDYSTGELSALDLNTMTSSNKILQGSVDSDLRVRSYNSLVYILNNTNGNIQLVDPNQSYSTIAQVSTGASSYPHDLLVTGSKAYVALNGLSKLWIVNASSLVKTGEIDLSSYTPSGASNPSIDQLWMDSSAHRLYVSIGRLYYSGSFATADYSSVLVINTETETVMSEIVLKWTVSSTTTYALNPYSKFVYASSTDWNCGDGHDHIFLLCQGLLNSSDWSDKNDGGIIAIDTTDLACESGFAVSESYLANAMSDFDYANGNFYVAASGSSTSTLFSVKSGDTGKTTLLQASSAYAIPFAKATSGGLLLAGDRTSTNPGIWIFNTTDNSLKQSDIISTYLPPTDITLMQ